MYQSPQKPRDPRLYGVSGTLLNGFFLLIVGGSIAAIAAWMFVFGGSDSLSKSFDDLKSEVTLLINGRDVPGAAIDAPDTWVTLNPDEGTKQTIIAEMRATNPEQAAAVERALSYFGGLEVLYLAFDPASSQGFMTNVSVIGERGVSSTTIDKEIALIEQQLPTQGGTVTSIKRDLTVGGYPAASMTTRYSVGGIELAGLWYTVLAEDNLVYAITFATTPDQFDARMPAFEQAAASFRVLDE